MRMCRETALEKLKRSAIRILLGAPQTVDVLRAIGGFSFVVLKRIFPDIAWFFESDQPQRALHIGRRAAAFFVQEPRALGSFDKNG